MFQSVAKYLSGGCLELPFVSFAEVFVLPSGTGGNLALSSCWNKAAATSAMLAQWTLRTCGELNLLILQSRPLRDQCAFASNLLDWRGYFTASFLVQQSEGTKPIFLFEIWWRRQRFWRQICKCSAASITHCIHVWTTIYIRIVFVVEMPVHYLGRPLFPLPGSTNIYIWRKSPPNGETSRRQLSDQ